MNSLYTVCLRSHWQAFWRHTSPPSTPVSCRSDSRPSPWSKLEASPRPSQQPMDWPATPGQQHTTSWPVEKIHHTWSFGSDATVLDDYALTTTSMSLHDNALRVQSPFIRATCAVPPSVIASQYATLNCKPLLVWVSL